MNTFLLPILGEIKHIIDSFTMFSCSHIYRERNHTNENLPIYGLLLEKDIWVITKMVNDKSHEYFLQSYKNPVGPFVLD